MAFTVKSKGQDENVVSTHLFFRLLTKLSMVISGIRMKSPSPTVVWSAITAAAGNHFSPSTTRKHNCPTVTQVDTNCPPRRAETALGAVPPGLEPWQLLGPWLGGSGGRLYTSPSTREPHRRFNRHDPALNIFNIILIILTVMNIKTGVNIKTTTSLSLILEKK